MTMELKIYNSNQAQEIEFNYEEIKAELFAQLEKYQGLTFTDEEIKLAKSEKASLTALKKAIDTRRIDIKKECMSAYDKFEVKIKEITAMIEKPILEIDSQVKKFEEKQKAEKQEAITKIYNDNACTLQDILSLSKIWNDKWLNATYKVKDIEWEIQQAVLKTESDLAIIIELKSEFEFQIKDKYLQTFDLAQALREKTRLDDAKAKAEEAKRIAEERRIELDRLAEEKRIKDEEARFEIEKKLEEAAKIMNDEKSRKFVEEFAERNKLEIDLTIPETDVVTLTGNILEIPFADTIVIEPQFDLSIPEPEQTIEELEFKVWVTESQKILLRDFLKNNNIKYGKVK